MGQETKVLQLHRRGDDPSHLPFLLARPVFRLCLGEHKPREGSRLLRFRAENSVGGEAKILGTVLKVDGKIEESRQRVSRKTPGSHDKTDPQSWCREPRSHLSLTSLQFPSWVSCANLLRLQSPHKTTDETRPAVAQKVGSPWTDHTANCLGATVASQRGRREAAEQNCPWTQLRHPNQMG